MKEKFCNQLQATSNASLFRIFFNQLKRQAPIFDKQNQNLRAPTHCPTPTSREIRQ